MGRSVGFKSHRNVATRWISGTLVLLILLCSYARAEDPFEQHRKAMLAAIAAHNVERVKALLKTPYVLIDEPVTGGNTYLCIAAQGNRWEIVDALIEAGADVTIPANPPATYDTAVGCSTGNGCAQCMRSIVFRLKKVATSSAQLSELIDSVNYIANIQGQTPLQRVVAGALMKNRNDEFGNPKGPAQVERELSLMIDLLVQNGANVNATYPNHLTILKMARTTCPSSVVSYLIQHGAHD